MCQKVNSSQESGINLLWFQLVSIWGWTELGDANVQRLAWISSSTVLSEDHSDEKALQSFLVLLLHSATEKKWFTMSDVGTNSKYDNFRNLRGKSEWRHVKYPKTLNLLIFESMHTRNTFMKRLNYNIIIVDDHTCSWNAVIIEKHLHLYYRPKQVVSGVVLLLFLKYP